MTNELNQALNINPLIVAFPELKVLGVAPFFYPQLACHLLREDGSPIFPSVLAQVSPAMLTPTPACRHSLLKLIGCPETLAL